MAPPSGQEQDQATAASPPAAAQPAAVAPTEPKRKRLTRPPFPTEVDAIVKKVPSSGERSLDWGSCVSQGDVTKVYNFYFNSEGVAKLPAVEDNGASHLFEVPIRLFCTHALSTLACAYFCRVPHHR
jgi:hypothetical protein